MQCTMKKSAITFFLLGFILPFSFGQKKHSDSLSVSQMHFLRALPKDTSTFVVLQANDLQRPSQIGIQYYCIDSSSQIATKIVTFRKRGIDGQFEDCYIINNRLHLLYSLYYPGPKRNHLFCEIFDLPSLENVNALLIDEAYTPGLYRIPFGHSISPDSSKLLFYSWSYALPEDPAKITLQVYDAQMNLLWKQRYILPYKNETLFLYGSKVTNDGNVFLLGEDYQGKVAANMNINLSKIKRFALFAEKNKNDFLEFPILLKEYIPSDLLFEMDKNNNLVCMGFYQKNSTASPGGIFRYSIDYAEKKVTSMLYPIGKEDYQAAFSFAEKEGVLSSNKRGFRDYYTSRIYLEDNNTFTLVAEQQNQSNEVYFTEEGPQYGVEYNDILLANVSAQKIQWLKRIPKRQSEIWNNEKLVSSFGMIKMHQNYYLLYNDDKSNHQKKETKNIREFEYFSSPANILVEVSPTDGAIKRYDISSELFTLNSPSFIIPGFTNNFGNNSIFLYVEPKKDTPVNGQFLKFDLKQLREVH